MNTGKGFGKTILIGDQFVLWEVPAVLATIPFETICTVERLESGSGWILDDRRIEVPGYKKAKEKDCNASFDRMVEVLGLDLDKNPIKIIVEGDLPVLFSRLSLRKAYDRHQKIHPVFPSLQVECCSVRQSPRI